VVRVPDTGGTPTRVATLPWKPGQDAFVWPRFLPDGQHFLLSKAGDPALYVASLDSMGMQRVMEDGSAAVYAAGHLLFLRNASLFVRPFDPARLTFTGPEWLLAPRAAFFSVSDNGMVVYRPDRTVGSRLAWFDRRGRRTDALAEPGPYTQVVLSPGGRRAMLVRRDTRGTQTLGNSDLWEVDLTSGILSRVTSDPAPDTDPSWSPDERHVAYSSRRLGPMGVFVKDLNSGAEQPLVQWKEPILVDQWTPDGRFIIFRRSGFTVWAMPLGSNAKPIKLFDTPYVKDEVHVSPDGRWVAYHADESGRWEVYVARFPAFTAKRQISVSGGLQPQWSGDGKELFYLSGDGWLMTVRVSSDREFVGSPPVRLFAARIEPSPGQPQYAVSRDGKRFLGLEPVEGEPNTLTFLLNAFDASPSNWQAR
jgi:serine/threonine-protein kinase